MRENRYFVIPVNILTPVCARPVFLGRTTHYRVSWYSCLYLYINSLLAVFWSVCLKSTCIHGSRDFLNPLGCSLGIIITHCSQICLYTELDNRTDRKKHAVHVWHKVMITEQVHGTTLVVTLVYDYCIRYYCVADDYIAVYIHCNHDCMSIIFNREHCMCYAYQTVWLL